MSTPDTPAQLFPEMPEDGRYDLRDALEAEIAMTWANFEATTCDHGHPITRTGVVATAVMLELVDRGYLSPPNLDEEHHDH